MTIKILTEAGYNVGFGHYYRMSGVCDTISEAGGDIKMYICADEVARSNLTREWIEFADWLDPEMIDRIIGPEDTVVVDSYRVDLDELNAINERARDLIMIDDNIRLDYSNMIILNPNYFAMYLDYPGGKGNRYYLGKDYTLLREPFKKAGTKVIKEDVTDVLITMGGTDLKHRTQKAIGLIRETGRDVRLHIVVTNAYSDIEEIEAMIGKEDRLHSDIDAVEMCRLMMTRDFAVATAGGTSNELIKTQCPSVLYVVADNQFLNARYMAGGGYFELMEEGREKDIIDSFFDYGKRKEMADKLQTLHSDKSAVDLINEIAYGDRR